MWCCHVQMTTTQHPCGRIKHGRRHVAATFRVGTSPSVMNCQLQVHMHCVVMLDAARVSHAWINDRGSAWVHNTLCSHIHRVLGQPLKYFTFGIIGKLKFSVHFRALRSNLYLSGRAIYQPGRVFFSELLSVALMDVFPSFKFISAWNQPGVIPPAFRCIFESVWFCGSSFTGWLDILISHDFYPHDSSSPYVHI